MKEEGPNVTEKPINGSVHLDLLEDDDGDMMIDASSVRDLDQLANNVSFSDKSFVLVARNFISSKRISVQSFSIETSYVFSAASCLRRNSVDICSEIGFDELLLPVLVVVSDLLFWRDKWICRGPVDVVLHLHRIAPPGLPWGRRLRLKQPGQARPILCGISRFHTRRLGQTRTKWQVDDCVSSNHSNGEQERWNAQKWMGMPKMWKCLFFFQAKLLRSIML
nr:hypothetical protein [Tanacetum cinerariifolium]